MHPDGSPHPGEHPRPCSPHPAPCARALLSERHALLQIGMGVLGPYPCLTLGKKGPNPSGFGSRAFWTLGLSWEREVAGTEGAGALTHFKIALGLFLARPAPPSSPADPWGLGKQRPLVGTPTEGHLGSDGHKGALLTQGLGT